MNPGVIVMEFENSVIELVRRIKPVKYYDKKNIEERINSIIMKLIYDIKFDTPFKCYPRFQFIKKEELQRKEKKKLYGLSGSTDNYIIGIIKKSQYDLEDYGYALEKIIFFLTDLGLGTLWIRDTLNNVNLNKILDIKNDEIIPAIITFGYTVKKEKFHKLLNWTSGTKNKIHWDKLFFYKDFKTPIDEDEAGIYAMPLEMTRLAPSIDNKKPWRIIKSGGCFHFYLCEYGINKKTLKYNLQRLDIGVAMCHFELTADELDLNGIWKIINPEVKDVPDNFKYIVSWVIG